ncbi:MAG TPA: EamA family transporter [Candidatus Methylomirabilis sp.]|nr:EamA family transporter [Candidatus Methylomirabilis sp.]
MGNLAFAYAVGAGVSLAAYIIGARLGSSGTTATHPALGTAIVTGIAFLINVVLTLSIRATGAPIAFSMKSALALVIVGVATACVNLFTLLAYSAGLRVTSSFVIGGTSTMLVLLVGFLVFREPFTWKKLLAVGLIAAGTFLLQRAGVSN